MKGPSPLIGGKVLDDNEDDEDDYEDEDLDEQNPQVPQTNIQHRSANEERAAYVQQQERE